VKKSTVKKESRVVHPKHLLLESGNAPLIQAQQLSVKYVFDSYEALREHLHGERDGYLYARRGNPTTRELEVLLAEVQSQEDCITSSSGLSALTALFLSQLKAGDHIILLYEGYAPCRHFCRMLNNQYQVQVTELFSDQVSELERFIQPGKTKLFHFESPTNPALRILDIEQIVHTCQRHGVQTSIDNTLAGLHNHGQYDIDFFVHSLTKFACGHSDAMGGAILGSKEKISRVREALVMLGDYLAPDPAWRIMRGMKTYFLRYKAQAELAEKTAQFLAKHPQVRNVVYPGLSNHPQHELVKKQQKDFGSVVLADLDCRAEDLPKFFNALELFSITPSLGSVESLAVPLRLMYSGGMNAEQCARAGIAETSVRFALGVENFEDIQCDLERAFKALNG
jgi:cystathionine beta-lyase/cystathionine gamma-synthase